VKENSLRADVVILCGGMGTRLREETEFKPKPMVEIGGKPILWHIMKYYSSFGFRRFLIALGYRGEYIKKYFYDYRYIANDFTICLDPQAPLPTVHSKTHTLSDEKNWEIVCINTGLNALKGARIKRLEPYIQTDFFHLTYGDGLSDVELNMLEEFHRSHKRLGTVTSVHPPSRFGEMRIEGHLVCEFEEKPQIKTGYINGGFFVFNKKFLDCLTLDDRCDLEFGVLQKLCHDRELMTYKHDGYWQCMDTARDVEYLNRLWQTGNPPWKKWNHPER
jgi:glucose-1-phosphate cytidylyltransferase